MKKLLLSFVLFSIAFVLSSQNRQIDDLRRQQVALQEEIQNTNRLFLTVQSRSANILERIELISRQLSARRELIQTQNQEIAALTREERRLENEIARLDKELKQRKESYARAIRSMQNTHFNRNKLFFVLSGRTLGESLRRMQHLRDYSVWKRTQAEEIRERSVQISSRRTELSEARAGQERTRASLRTEEQKLQGEEQTHQTEISAARGQKQELQQRLQSQQQQVNRLNAQIERLIAEEVERQQRAQGRPGQAARAAAAENLALSGSFAAHRGQLPMPVTGSATIVGNFGIRRHAEWDITTNSNGIDIQAERGANARSVFEGEVSRIFSVPGSHTAIIVRHGDYFTFYSNIYELFVQQGDRVATGQALGRIFTDSETGMTEMHFQLWQQTTTLNPAPWLLRR
jgi:septal ring factor EnvC (AmiA/AmiB activator)